MDILVGTFNHDLYTLHFDPTTLTLSILHRHPSIAGHSWLALSSTKKALYCTAWTSPRPSVASYRLTPPTPTLSFLNARPIASLSGYVCVSATHLYSVGGPSGEVFRLEADGSIGELVQTLSFVPAEQETNQSSARGAVPHGDFGGLRHGAHSCDISPDGKVLWVADIGRNCVWSYAIAQADKRTKQFDMSKPHLTGLKRHPAPRGHDGPRHTTPHPGGRVLYSLQEHSSMVDVFSVREDDGGLEHTGGVKIIPAEKDCKHYWADEVRLSTEPEGRAPRYLYASTRGLERGTKGYVAVFELEDDGRLKGGKEAKALDVWETPTSGGIANAVEPAPWREGDGRQWLALTDSEEGWVFVLAFEGGKIREVARVNLGKTEEGEVAKAATALWL